MLQSFGLRLRSYFGVHISKSDWFLYCFVVAVFNVVVFFVVVVAIPTRVS